ncbi:uncharacterized protein LOC122798471 [Protopterus annectens]|uniref:uncharacterized protein LOC122798471 n=1 Tax=Protopterus annectens TaxID=7888 RepID=UPI001CF9EA37|nr:uncharacterized protein LOC122798471 [Protopterus annectens]XP_043923357.1 uncharacterized protein LOC122798471 [Protopterus annectens]
MVSGNNEIDHFCMARTQTGSTSDMFTVISNLLLCCVALHSAHQTFQINRGSAAGFLLEACASALGTFAVFIPDLAPLQQHAFWVAVIIGMPLLAFGFHWLCNDHSTANTLLISGLILGVSSDHITVETCAILSHTLCMLTLISILIVSIFTANWYGIFGSVLMHTACLFSVIKGQQLLALRKDSAVNCILSVGLLLMQCAVKKQHSDLTDQLIQIM